jgi:hypothetical protein
MEVNGQFHALATLPSGKEPSIMAQEPIWYTDWDSLGVP